MSADAFRVEEVALDDDRALDELLAFAAQHGTPRATTAVAYRDMTGDVEARLGFVARRADGELAAAALATLDPAIGLEQIQLNAFLAPAAQDAFDAVLRAAEAWGGARGARAATAHVSGPSDDDLAAWRASGYEQVGERARVIRDVRPEDADAALPAVEGVTIGSLEEHPQLLDAADELWRTGLRDVPSALRFAADDVPSLSEEISEKPGRAHVAIAVDDATGALAGFALLIRMLDPTVAGHRMTATAREFRGRGIATALKVAALRWAASNGVTRLQASNDDANAPMRAINDRLGYRLDYRLVLLRRGIDR